MRKMTKTAVTLAAMSAMTIASASLAFAATSQVDGLTAIKAETQTTTGPDTGLWNGDNRDGWTFTTDDGIKLKNTWAEIDDIISIKMVLWPKMRFFILMGNHISLMKMERWQQGGNKLSQIWMLTAM